MSHKVLVIGAGLAGVSAALAAKDAGADVRVLWKAYGASGLGSGTLDLAYEAGCSATPSHELNANLKSICSIHSGHPYAVLNAKGGIESDLRSAAERLRSALGAVGYASNEPNANALRLATWLGTWKMSHWAGQSHAAGDLEQLAAGAKVLVLGFRGLRDFRATAVATTLSQCAPHLKIEAREMALPGINQDFIEYSASAQAIDKDVAAFAAAFAAAVAGSDAELILLPPALGLTQHAAAFAAIRASAGATKVAEVLAGNSSIPGIRLQRALLAVLETEGITNSQVEVASVSKIKKNIRTVLLKDGSQIETERLVLASGKFIGGGLRKEKAFVETIVGLPIFCEGRRVEEIYSGNLLNAKVTAEQALFSAGVRVDAACRPLDARHRLLYDNLFVAGSLLGGYDYALQHCGAGVAILSGAVAGREASQ